MSEALDRLKNIGAQKIYEDTHIPAEHVQAILYESFDGLSKVQFIGFISILEREYGEDLTTIRSQGIRYFDENDTPEKAIVDDTIFNSSKKKNTTLLYIIFAILLFVVAIVYSMQSETKTVDVAVKENTIVKEVKNTIIADVNSSDDNESDMNNSSVVNDINRSIGKEVIKKEETPKIVPKSFKIIARTKVWLGYIDIATNKKYQKTFTGEFDLDPTKEWLLYLGHGYVDVIIDGEKEHFNDKNTLRLLYKDGKTTQLSLDKFKELNRGNAW
jgi:hypothetical protein